ncbi:MAG TPA: PAS domain S-box protein [Candidatus Methanoperedens sp.]
MKGIRITVKNPDDIKNRVEEEKQPAIKMKLVFLNHVASSSDDFDKICKLSGIAVSTGYQWVREWNEKGYESVMEKENRGGRPPKLSDYDLMQLGKYLKEKEHWKTKEVKLLIKERFGIDLSEDQISRILKQKLKMDFSCREAINTAFEEKYRNFFENAADAFIINDLEDRIMAWNPGAENMFGWTANEAIGKKSMELIVPPPQQEERYNIMLSALSGRRISGIETVYARKDGTKINVGLTVFPMRDSNQNITGLSYILRDITRSRRAEEGLRESEEKLKNVMESAPIGISINTYEGMTIDINSTGLKIFGYESKEDFLGKPISAHYYDPKDKVLFYEMAKKGRVEDFEIRLRRKDGSMFWGSLTSIAQTETNQFINVFRDITERKRTEDVLRQIYDELELKVRERTEDLEKATELVQAEITERKKASEALRESEIRYRNLVESARDIIITFSSDGKITLLNPAFETVTGWPRAQWIGKNIQALFHPDYIQPAKEIYKSILNGEVPLSGFEIRILSKSGEYIAMEYSLTPEIRNGKIVGAFGIARDITDRKRAEEELHRAYDELETRVKERTAELEQTNNELMKEQRHAENLALSLKKERDTLNIIMENTGTRLAYLDSKFNFIRVNSSYARDLGYNKDELLGYNYFKIFPNSENQMQFEKVRDTGEPVEFKAQMFRFTDQPWRGITYWDWTLTPVKDARGDIDRLVLSLTDVTERIRIEQTLQKALAYAESIIDTVPEPLVILDSDMRVKMANHAFYKTFKVSKEETKNRLLYDLGNRQWDIPGLREMLVEIIPRGKLIQNFEVEQEFPGIGRRTMMLNARSFYQEDTERILFAIEDITDRKKMDEILLENERLISASKARSEFLTIMSHELRTPLTSVIGYSIILMDKTHGDLNKKQEFYVDSIVKSSNHLLSLINTILDLAKIEAGKLELVVEEVPVGETINEILNLIKEKAEKRNVILKHQYDPKLRYIMADRQKFKQILFNLLSNAVKFSKEAGGIVSVSAIKEGDMAKISVADTGIGIRKKDMERLFCEFEQLDSGITRKYEGTGLGLAITKQLVELHRGKIMAESKYGKGSTFTFLLPLVSVRAT